ncbi:hypothetical protein, variant 1 [Aphanomyces invadans]|uniref:ERCC1-like central domain-containing protein n=1 Tax=Aphanomyces invadans TaxID=157072 RepID=A0A024UWR7_9STRA|nr:hypothetical protein, variant 1 [Aphanomyces invadans]ETW10128.1 hypothetical protein, variant 1 [Aphanomyces invadans]|eukprot:XP_008861539.1 hypothetical protein, variant 1 [Aphanomyces invadans]
MSDDIPRSKLDSRNETPPQHAIGEPDMPRYLTRADAFNNTFQGVGTATAPPPREQLVKKVTGTMVVLVHPSQSGNPMLNHMQNVLPEVNADVTADYMMGDTCAAYFISVRYHMLHPHYLKNKLARATRVKVQVVVCHVDVADCESALKEINCEALGAGFTLLLAWSWKETLKAYENKSAALIKEKIDGDFNSQLVDVLTTVRSVNKTDVLTLSGSFGSLSRIMNATEEELALCPGIGGKKVQQLLEAFNQPFQS